MSPLSSSSATWCLSSPNDGHSASSLHSHSSSTPLSISHLHPTNKSSIHRRLRCRSFEAETCTQSSAGPNHNPSAMPPTLVAPYPSPLPRLTIPANPTIHALISRFRLRSSQPCSMRFCRNRGSPPSILTTRASETEAQTSRPDSDGGGGEGEGGEERYEEYEVELEQPYGIKFAKGRDGGTYIDAIAAGGSADKSKKFAVGDRVLATSAVFGTEVWPAAEYGRTMYTIRQRIGPLLMRMQKRYGKLDDTGELTEKEIIRAERNSGVISGRVREIQMQNYLRKKEQKERREMELRQGLQLYKNAKYEEALLKFESVLGSKPDPNETAVASYNVACCYSKLNQLQAGLSALEDALQAGFEDFKRIRTDPDLAKLRTSKDFEALLKSSDESFINENAINAIKSLFGIFNKK